MVTVLIVPETEQYAFNVSHENLVWVNKKLGVPDLRKHNTRYIAPLWLREPAGINRVYHIRKTNHLEDCTEYLLGNSFVLDNPWNNPAQRRRFEYLPLSDLGFSELQDGVLICKNWHE